MSKALHTPALNKWHRDCKILQKKGGETNNFLGICDDISQLSLLPGIEGPKSQEKIAKTLKCEKKSLMIIVNYYGANSQESRTLKCSVTLFIYIYYLQIPI